MVKHNVVQPSLVYTAIALQRMGLRASKQANNHAIALAAQHAQYNKQHTNKEG